LDDDYDPDSYRDHIQLQVRGMTDFNSFLCVLLKALVSLNSGIPLRVFLLPLLCGGSPQADY
jgi:hypothetical protein